MNTSDQNRIADTRIRGFLSADWPLASAVSRAITGKRTVDSMNRMLSTVLDWWGGISAV